MSDEIAERDIGPYPYVGKSIAEIVHDYAVVRGDLIEQYARDQLVDIIERRIAQARRDAVTEVTARLAAVYDNAHHAATKAKR